jgi:hypothetical protein
LWQVTNSTNLSWNVISTSLGRLMLENTIALVFWGLKFTGGSLNCFYFIYIYVFGFFVKGNVLFDI